MQAAGAGAKNARRPDHDRPHRPGGVLPPPEPAQRRHPRASAADQKQLPGAGQPRRRLPGHQRAGPGGRREGAGALAAWPSVQPGWNGNELAWYRRAEGYSLKLLEVAPATRPANAGQAPDHGPAFRQAAVAAGGDYEAQIQPWKLWGDLPPDAYADRVPAPRLVAQRRPPLLAARRAAQLPGATCRTPSRSSTDISFARTISDREFRSTAAPSRRRWPEAAALISAVRNDHEQVSDGLAHSVMGAIAARHAAAAGRRRPGQRGRPGGAGAAPPRPSASSKSNCCCSSSGNSSSSWIRSPSSRPPPPRRRRSRGPGGRTGSRFSSASRPA